MIGHAFHWTIVLNTPLVILGFVVLFVLIMLGWGFFLSLLDQSKDEARAEGYDSGYLRGRRDERADFEAGITLPFGERHSLGDAHYPLITETLEDGSKRRLDR